MKQGQVEQVVCSADCRSAEHFRHRTGRVSEQIRVAGQQAAPLADHESAEPFDFDAYSRAETERDRRQYLETERRHSRARSHRIRGNGGSFTEAQWQAQVKKYAGLCFYCAKPTKMPVVEHRTPVSRGGTSDISNIVPACRSCNSKKGAMTEAEYLMKLFPALAANLGNAESLSEEV